MFEVGFSELLMVGLVALLVIGPERLPKAARIAGFWLGKSKRTMVTVKAEIQRELLADELRQQLPVAELQAMVDDSAAAAMEIDDAMAAFLPANLDVKGDNGLERADV